MLSGDALAGGLLDRVEIDGQPALRDIDLVARHFDSRGAQRLATLTLSRPGMHARGADGNALEQIELRWSHGAGTASLWVRDDFAAVRNAIAALVRASLAGKFDGFGAYAFRRAHLMPALFSSMGTASGTWCCLDTSSLPPAQAAPIGSHDTAARGTAAEAHAGFHRYCGQCHLGNERTPPNFLAGDADAVEAKLQQCAPRIFVRLSMWRREPGARAKTPMPPEVALRRFDLNDHAWRDGEAYSDLLNSVDDRLRAETGSAPKLDELLRPGYENLRACLPDATTAGLPPRSLR